MSKRMLIFIAISVVFMTGCSAHVSSYSYSEEDHYPPVYVVPGRLHPVPVVVHEVHPVVVHPIVVHPHSPRGRH